MRKNNGDFTPIPTEYKGIVYRSKSEAMFARYLELEIEESVYLFSGPMFHKKTFGSGVGGFVYEPWDLEIDGWVPDFLRWDIRCDNDGISSTLPYILNTIIEYKPSRPTKTNVKTFFDRCFRLFHKYRTEHGDDVAYGLDFELYFGSIFNEDRGVFHSVSFGSESIGYCEESGDWLSNFEEDVKATRFDLEAVR